MAVTQAAKPTRRDCLQSLLAGTLCVGAALADAQSPAPGVEDDIWTDAPRKRDVPVRVRWPQSDRQNAALPVVLFSHGLGGTRDGGTVWGEAWAAAGFVVVHIQHPGSDLAAVSRTATSFSDKAGLRAAAGAAQLFARLQDVGFVLSQISLRHEAQLGRWATVRPSAVGMSGHSFGAHTTLGMAGQRYPGFEGISEQRLASFIAFSPTVPSVGDAQQAFGRLSRPVLTLTGTRDEDVLGNGATPDKRIAVFPALPPGGKAQLVLQDADHMTFGGQIGRAAEIVPRESVTRDQQARDHALVAAITTDWWRATLFDDAAAQARLIAPVGLGPGDRWQQK